MREGFLQAVALMQSLNSDGWFSNSQVGKTETSLPGKGNSQCESPAREERSTEGGAACSL